MDAHPHREPVGLAETARQIGWLPTVCGVLDEQTRLIEALHAHSDRQGELLASGDFDAVADVLQDRQPIVERLHELSAQIEPVLSQVGSLWQALTPVQQSDLTKRVHHFQTLLDSVRARDEEDRRLLDAHRAAIGQELAGLSRGRSALGAYGEPESDDAPRFQDREG